MQAPIELWLLGDDLTRFSWTLDFNDPATPDVDMRETWILLDFLQGSALKNAVLDCFFNHIKVDTGTPAYFRGRRYFIDRVLIDYLFEHKLWITQFGRAVLYIIRKEIQEVATGHDEDTLDTDFLPAWLENLLGGAEQDFNYLPWYFDLLRLILTEMVRPFDLPEEDDDSIAYFCGVAHHHPNEPRCRDPPEYGDEDGDEDGDGDGDGDVDGYVNGDGNGYANGDGDGDGDGSGSGSGNGDVNGDGNGNANGNANGNGNGDGNGGAYVNGYVNGYGDGDDQDMGDDDASEIGV